VWRAWCYLKLNRAADAEKAFKTYMILFPDGNHRDEVRLQLARLAYREHNHAEAEKLYTGIMTNAADRFFAELASYELGWVYVNQGKREAAVQQFSRFASQFPKSELYDDIQYYLGETYFNMKEYDRARAVLLRIIKEMPSSTYAGPGAYWSALAAYRMGEISACDEILTSYWPVIQDSRYKAAAMLLKGDCLAAQGLSTQAVHQFEATCIAATGSYIAVEAQFRIGDTCLSLSNASRAIELYTPLTKDVFAANRARAHLSLGKAQAMAGNVRDALSEWLLVIYDYPAQTRIFKEAVSLAATTYDRLNEPDRAEQIYRISLEAASRNGSKDTMPDKK
jgi:TolA-binding protein